MTELEKCRKTTAGKILHRLLLDYRPVADPLNESPLELTEEAKQYNLFVADLYKWVAREAKKWGVDE